MSTLRIFIDESGNFEFGNKRNTHYLFTLVLHNQEHTIESQLMELQKKLDLNGYAVKTIHTAPLIHMNEDYDRYSLPDRRRIFTYLFQFLMSCPASYRCFAYNKTDFLDKMSLESRMSRDLSLFISENLGFFQSFDKIVIYYDRGQAEITRMLNIVFNTLLVNVSFHITFPSKYRLFQAADLICTLELANMKLNEGDLSRQEERFFNGQRGFRRNFMRHIKKKEFSSKNSDRAKKRTLG